MNLSKTKKIILGLLLSLCLAIGLYTFRYPTVQQLQAVNFLSLEDNIIELELVVLLENHHLITANLHYMEANIFINDRFMGRGSSQQSIRLNAQDTTQAKLKLQLDLASFSELFAAMETQREAVVLKTDGRYTMDGYFNGLVIKAISQQKIDLRQQVQTIINQRLTASGIAIESLSSKEVSVSQTKMVAKVSLNNPFPFDYQLQAVNLDLFLGEDGHKIGSWKLPQVQDLKAKEKALVKAEIKINNFSILGQMGDGLQQGKGTVFARGAAQVEIAGKPFKFPVAQAIPMTDILF